MQLTATKPQPKTAQAATGKWLNRVVQGYFNYHAEPENLYRLALYLL